MPRPTPIKLARVQLGWTIQEAAEAAGLAWITVHRAELAGANPKFDTVKALARAYGLTLDELVGDDSQCDRCAGVLSATIHEHDGMQLCEDCAQDIWEEQQERKLR